MVSSVVLGIFVVVILYWIYKYCTYRPEGFPPGPPRIPLVGSYFLLLFMNYKNLHLAIDKLCKFYNSSVIGFYSADTLTVIANDQKSIREMLLNPQFDGRNDFLIGRLREPDYKLRGIFFTDGGYWKEQRRFTLKNLRDFGFGRRYPDFEIEVRDEMQSLIAMIKEGPKYEHEKVFLRRGEMNLPKALIGSLGNCFLQILAGERLPRAEQGKIFKAGYAAMTFAKMSNEYGKLFSFIPWIRFFFPRMSSFQQLRGASMELWEYLDEVINKAVESHQDGHARNFLDLYIKELKEDRSAGVNRGYVYDQLHMISVDFMLAALSTVESTIAFLFKHLLHRRDVLRRIQDEIDVVVGAGRLPELDDRVNMPYTEATLREIMRFETLVQSSVPHRALLDTTLAGFKVPKDTILLAGLYAMHNEKSLWIDPENFRPERFLNPDGKLNLKKDFSLPFGAGRRLCASETFARNTMFLCIAALLQNFDLKPSGELPNLTGIEVGLTRKPKDFWIKLVAR